MLETPDPDGPRCDICGQPAVIIATDTNVTPVTRNYCRYHYDHLTEWRIDQTVDGTKVVTYVGKH